VRLTVDPHPLLADLLCRIRDVNTPASSFAALVDRAATILLVRATADIPVVPVDLRTPLAEARGERLAQDPLLVPILRAGLGMLAAANRMLPESAVAFVGLRRDERTAEPSWYLDALPDSLADTPVLILEPMIATGGTLGDVITRISELGAPTVTVLSLICAPEGIEALRRSTAGLACEVHVIVAASDPGLDSNNFISPGLGDAGDRLFGAG